MTLLNKASFALYLCVIIGLLNVSISNAFAAGAERAKKDTNGDGAIDLTEMIDAATAKTERRFDRKDADDDGLVTFDEYIASGRASTDLTLYADEIIECVADLKEELGSETIQVPSVDDFKTPQEKFDSVDSDLDGMVTLDEAILNATNKATMKFNLLDADEDGLVTKEEKRALHSENKGTRKALKQCIDEVTTDSLDAGI